MCIYIYIYHKTYDTHTHISIYIYIYTCLSQGSQCLLSNYLDPRKDGHKMFLTEGDANNGADILQASEQMPRTKSHNWEKPRRLFDDSNIVASRKTRIELKLPFGNA